MISRTSERLPASSAPHPEPAPDERKTIPTGIVLLFLLALIVHLAAGAIGWDHRIIQDDVSAFRQAQTALNTYWMLDHRYRVAYETPVFGPPWTMPYELPVYEWLVAGLVTLTRGSLDQAGRAVAQGFFLLCLWPCWSLLGRLGLEPRRRLLGLVLLLVSPFYLFWSRAFLIESTALFLALAYLAAAWAFLDRPRPGLFLLALALGVLAALVKITTCAGAWLGLALLLPGLLGPAGRRWRGLAWLTLVGVPLLAGMLWTRYADGLKEQNSFAQHLTSRALQEWNFGAWALRWQSTTWGIILGRTTAMLWQNVFLGASLLLALLAGRRRLPVAACVLIYLVLPLVFTNLYYIHEYYAYASMVFLVGAVALAVAGLGECGGWRAWAGGVVAAAFLAVAGYSYLEEYYPKQASNHLESAGVCQAVQEQTHPEEVILVLGCDWSSEVPYYARRRALMVPFWGTTPLEDLPHYLEALRGYRLGALVVRREYIHGDRLAGVMHTLRSRELVPELEFQDDVYALYVLRPAPVANGS